MGDMQTRTCAFTGHRPHKFPWRYNEAAPRCAALKAVLMKQITALVKAGVTDFFTGGADGVDLWCGQIVLELRKKDPTLRLHCILPHEGQADKWNDSAREQYHDVLNKADSVDYVSRVYYDGCMIERNHRLVESAGRLLAVSGGAWRSGTAATIRYARKLGREIWIIDPATLNIAHDGGNENERNVTA